MKIIQITDTHLDHNTPDRLEDLNECIEEVNKNNPDLVIHTGDITHNGLIQEYATARHNLDSLQAPYYVMNGNKDNREYLKATFSGHDYLLQNSKFIQYSINQLPVRIIAIDTVREDTSKGELCQDRLQNLQELLQEDPNKPTLIFMHHSPFAVEEIPDPHQFHEWDQVEALRDLLAKFKNVKAIYCGHVHRNVEGMLGSLPVHVLTCMAKDLRKGKLTDNDKTRPMYRIIDLNEFLDN